MALGTGWLLGPAARAAHVQSWPGREAPWAGLSELECGGWAARAAAGPRRLARRPSPRDGPRGARLWGGASGHRGGMLGFFFFYFFLFSLFLFSII